MLSFDRKMSWNFFFHFCFRLLLIDIHCLKDQSDYLRIKIHRKNLLQQFGGLFR